MNKKVAKLDKTLKEKIRNLYVQGFDNEQGERVMYSLAELAKRFSVGQSTLSIDMQEMKTGKYNRTSSKLNIYQSLMKREKKSWFKTVSSLIRTH